MPQDKWLFISGRGFYPHAGINILLTADFEARVRIELDERIMKDQPGGTPEEARKDVLKRDLDDAVGQSLYNYPGIFKVIDTTKYNDDRNLIADEVLKFIKELSLIHI